MTSPGRCLTTNEGAANGDGWTAMRYLLREAREARCDVRRVTFDAIVTAGESQTEALTHRFTAASTHRLTDAPTHRRRHTTGRPACRRQRRVTNDNANP
jgi:hypothetical protein